MKKLLAMALCLVAVSGYAQKGKEKIAADFYGVDYSCVDVKGADEEPGAFIKAFEAINRLFLSEPKKYDVAGFTGIDILSTGVEQANESLGALAAEQFTPRSAATDWQTQLPQIVARYDNGSGNKGLVLVATTLDKGNRSGLLHRSAVRSRDARDNHPDGHGRQARRLRPAQLLGRFGLQRPQKTGKIPDQVGQVPS